MYVRKDGTSNHTQKPSTERADGQKWIINVGYSSPYFGIDRVVVYRVLNLQIGPHSFFPSRDRFRDQE